SPPASGRRVLRRERAGARGKAVPQPIRIHRFGGGRPKPFTHAAQGETPLPQCPDSPAASGLSRNNQLKMGSAVVSTALVGLPPTSWQHPPWRTNRCVESAAPAVRRDAE